MAKKPLFIAIRTLLHSIKPLLRYDCTPFALQNDPFWSAKRPLLLRNAVLLELRRLHICYIYQRTTLYINNICTARAKLKNFAPNVVLLVQLTVLSGQKCKYCT